MCLDFQQPKLKEKIIHHEIPGKQWEVIGADMFNLNNENYSCIVDYNSNFPVVEKTICRQLNTNMPFYFFQKWFTQENNVRHR